MNFGRRSSGGRLSVHDRMPREFPICVSRPRPRNFSLFKIQNCPQENNSRVPCLFLYSSSNLMRGPPLFASSFHWFTGLYVSFDIGQSDYFAFVFILLSWKPLYLSTIRSLQGQWARVSAAYSLKHTQPQLIVRAQWPRLGCQTVSTLSVGVMWVTFKRSIHTTVYAAFSSSTLKRPKTLTS